MVITGVSRGIGQLQVHLNQEKDPSKRDGSHVRTLKLILWDPVGLNVFLEDCETFFNLAEVFTQKQHVSFKMGQVPPCSGIRSSSCLFWSMSTNLCWLFKAILRNLILRNLILGVFFRIALIRSPEWYLRSLKGS